MELLFYLGHVEGLVVKYKGNFIVCWGGEGFWEREKPDKTNAFALMSGERDYLKFPLTFSDSKTGSAGPLGMLTLSSDDFFMN